MILAFDHLEPRHLPSGVYPDGAAIPDLKPTSLCDVATRPLPLSLSLAVLP